MKDRLNIFVDRLVGGNTEEIDEEFDPAVLKVEDGLLSFNYPLHVSGQAYLAEDFLVLKLDIKTIYEAPCKICSEVITTPFDMRNVYLTEEVSNIRSKVYDVLLQVRDTVFINIPDYSECEGNCPMREQLNQFLKNPRRETVEHNTDTDFKEL